eukprot:3847686-Pleurochrysis_carterae.AAC.2
MAPNPLVRMWRHTAIRVCSARMPGCSRIHGARAPSGETTTVTMHRAYSSTTFAKHKSTNDLPRPGAIMRASSRLRHLLAQLPQPIDQLLPPRFLVAVVLVVLQLRRLHARTEE